MQISVTCEHIFYRTPTGELWVQGAPVSFWERYLEVFDRLIIVGRVAEGCQPPEGSERIEHPRISIAAVPYYRGPWQFARRLLRVRAALRRIGNTPGAILMRVPSTLANVLAPLLISCGRPYGLEVLGDPYDVFARGVVEHPLRPLLRRWYSFSQQRQCAHSCATAYVTESRLQSRYPSADAAFQTHYSSLVLPDEAFLPTARVDADFAKSQFRLITVAKMAQMYKGVDVLLTAMAGCVANGLNLRLDIVGDGPLREQLTKHAVQHGLADRVCFHGFVPSGDPVWRLLDQADLFVLASRTEGLPRSMIEAMARSLPCVGTNVGGIPELLPQAHMVPPNDADALARLIQHVLASPASLAEMSTRNRETAEHYRAAKLRARQFELYTQLQSKTSQWQAGTNELGATSSIRRRPAA